MNPCTYLSSGPNVLFPCQWRHQALDPGEKKKLVAKQPSKKIVSIEIIPRVFSMTLMPLFAPKGQHTLEDKTKTDGLQPGADILYHSLLIVGVNRSVVEVRQRDNACRVTGTKIRNRDQEDNVKGFHVGHIFPLGYVPMGQLSSLF
jgi:hypothetical protein